MTKVGTPALLVAVAAAVMAATFLRVDAQSLRLCVYEDASCSERESCRDFSNGCQNVDGTPVSIRSEIDCTETDGMVEFSTLILEIWENSKDCPSDVTPVDFSLPGTNITENTCYVDEEAGSYRVTNVNCGGGDCFPAFARVQLEDGSRKAMHEINIGDMVKVSATDNYSPVVFWGHKDPNAVGQNFVRVTFEDERVLMLTANHLAYVNSALVPAYDIRAGMLMTDAEAGREIRVESVEFTMRAKGLYMPHTAHGDLVVDGIVVSSYASVAPRMAHALLLIERVVRAVGFSALGNLLEKKTPWLLERAMSVVA